MTVPTPRPRGCRGLRELIFAAAVVGCGTGSDVTAGMPSDTVTASLVAMIGSVDGSPEDLFGDVTSIAVGPNGVVCIADRIGSTVRAWDPAGRFLGTIGSEGPGPGEFRFPNDLAFDAAGRLYVRDYTRISVFEQGPDHDIPDVLVWTVPRSGVPSLWSARGRVVDQIYYDARYVFRNGERTAFYYEGYDSTGATGDTLRVPSVPNSQHLARASYPISDRVAPNLDGVSRAPFEPAASWDLTSRASILASTGDDDEVVEFAASGDTVRVLRAAYERRRVPAGELRDSTRAFRARIDSIPVPLDRVRGMSDAARSGNVPTFVPSVIALHIDEEGDIWLRRWPPSDGKNRTVFDVFDDSGHARRTVAIPGDLMLDPPPFVSSGLVAGVVADPATAVERIAVYRIPGR